MLKNPTVLYDPTLCTGCRGCQVACKQWNNMPGESTAWFGGPSYTNPKWASATTWLVLQMHEEKVIEGEIIWAFTQRRCHHCSDPVCVKSCPADPKAASRNAEGIVTIDPKLCIGCGTCVENCPFEAPQVSEEFSIARKCTMCLDRQLKGKIPACANTCPTGATTFGERDDLIKIAQARAKKFKKGVVYGIKEGGGSAVLYVLPYGREFEGFPENPKPRGAGQGVSSALRGKGSLGQPRSGTFVLGSAALGLTWLAERKEKVHKDGRK